MNSKLTLSINKLVIEQAKNYAKVSGKSLSIIVEEYLKSLSKVVDRKRPISQLDILNELKGSVKLPKGKNLEDILEEALLEKYFKDE